MSDEQSLREAIWDNFDDDTPRLIYADWLEENGDPDRAEFIRIQCAIAQGESCTPGYRQLVERETEILKEREAEWVARSPKGFNTKFVRGFLSLDFRRPDYLLYKETDDWWSRHEKLVQEATLWKADYWSGVENHLGQVPESPLLGKFPSVVLRRMEDEHVARVVPRLRPRKLVVGVEHYGITNEGLSSMRELTQLRFLELFNLDSWTSFEINDAGLNFLEFLPNLRSLTIGGKCGIQGLNGSGLAHLPETEHFRELKLKGTMRQALKSIRHLRSLRTLSLQGTGKDGDLRHLKECRAIAQLDLKLEWAPRGLTHLNELPSLTKLRLRSYKVTGKTNAGFSRLEVPGLQELDMDVAAVEGAGWKHLTTFPRLQKLRLWSCHVTESEMPLLGSMSELRWLDLTMNRLTDESLQHLVPLTNLEVAKLSCTGVSDAAVEHLLKLPNLKVVDVCQTRVTKKGIARLQERFPQAQIYSNPMPPEQR